MATETSICNLALGNLGKLSSPIANLFTDMTPAAITCRTIYNDVRQAVLRDHAWKFGNKIDPLSLHSDKTVKGWSYVYAYPSDCLNILKIFNDGTPETTATEEYDKIQKDGELVIVTNAADAYIKYTAETTNPALYDASFVYAFSWLLAVSLALPLTGEQSKQDNAFRMYRAAIDAAKNANLNEGNNPQESTTDLIESR